eukprot:CAMPEP_0206440554 /NCGR_PEP_ID=MMETSP0324_2-20121206/12813_1 /ASSEMBLY_ACC=CAM_ASM_000836 /TAXON_ID=2866 /ORGANISM="Crypthecodinium cohnii, Strain Seligo" /LENGTH=147 /DNA_ID=CAMNT_0053908263 /DNA_START=98 /DNA_END=541 /DNA_ORIENTATION=+
MGKFIKAGRVVVLLQGRHAGKKAVITKAFDDGSKARKFGHALVAGIERPFKKVTKKMSQKKIKNKLRCKAFVKFVNYNHMMPTRYTVPSELQPANFVTEEQMHTSDGRSEARKYIQNLLKEKFITPPLDKSGRPSKDVAFLRKKLRF